MLIKEPNRGTLINPDLKQQTAKPATTGKTVTIGAVWAGFPDAMTIGITDGIKAFASENQVGFQLFQSPEGHAKVLDYLHHLQEHDISGIVILPYNFDGYADVLRHLQQRKIPMVCVDRPVEGVELSSVEVDNAGGVYRAVVKLLVTFRRPVYYLGAEPGNQTQKLRYQGYCQAMNDGGFEQDVKRCTLFLSLHGQQSGILAGGKETGTSLCGSTEISAKCGTSRQHHGDERLCCPQHLPGRRRVETSRRPGHHALRIRRSAAGQLSGVPAQFRPPAAAGNRIRSGKAALRRNCGKSHPPGNQNTSRRTDRTGIIRNYS
ncbi:MAG: LacI family transcriptional regulator [Lentisphaeria bacterium]|nr:MAG: LacI family transcriptional regulator [Lentisphaeria bacterium]